MFKKRQRAYRTWKQMLDRCYNKKNPSYLQYGGRGKANQKPVKVCKRWSVFEDFFNDMGYPPERFDGIKMSLDRFPDPTGDYSPDNCRWATPKEQAANKRPKEQWYIHRV